MPLIQLDIIEGKDEKEIVQILDEVHKAAVEAFDVPISDRYQIVHQHKPYELILKDTDLGFDRTDDVIVISVTSKAREENMKVKFYDLVTLYLEDKCKIHKNDIIVNITENDSPDWSFGGGRAQFLTGDL